MSPTKTPSAPQNRDSQSRGGQGKGRRDKVRARQAAQKRAQRQRQLVVAVIVGAVLVAAVVVGVIVGKSGEKKVTAVPKAASGSGIAIGQPSAPVLLDVYEDFQCPSCERFETTTGPTVEKLIEAGTIRAVYHQFAFLGPESVRASNAASCASDQNQFLPFHNVLYARQPAEHSGGFTNSQLVSYGATIGLTSDTFKSCVNDGRYTNWVTQATDNVSKSGVNSTPTVKLNGTLVDTAVLYNPDAFKAAVENLAKK